MEKSSRKSKEVRKEENKKVVTIGIVVLIMAIVVITAISISKQKSNNGQKEDIVEYGGMIFNQEMNLNNINLIMSGDEEPIQVPVPKGYTASSVESERKVNGGFVIYEGEEVVTEANLEEAKKTRNQYVWIPIEDASDMYWTDNTTKNIYGAIYSFSGTGYTRGASSKYEPSLVSYDKEATYLTKYMNGITRDKFLKEMQIEFYEMLKSVETYGGFYIGRYETGNLSQNVPVTVKMNTDIGSQTWYNMYKRTKRMSGLNESVATTMIWRIQRDETLKWLIDTGNKTYEEVATNSTSWGNYYNATFEYTNTSGGTSTKNASSSTKIPTGSAEYTIANNIYDLAGNVWEWTMEGSGSSRCCYGGGCNIIGTNYPASYRNGIYPSYSISRRRFACSTLYKVALDTGGDAL